MEIRSLRFTCASYIHGEGRCGPRGGMGTHTLPPPPPFCLKTSFLGFTFWALLFLSLPLHFPLTIHPLPPLPFYISLALKLSLHPPLSLSLFFFLCLERFSLIFARTKWGSLPTPASLMTQVGSSILSGYCYGVSLILISVVLQCP